MILALIVAIFFGHNKLIINFDVIMYLLLVIRFKKVFDQRFMVIVVISLLSNEGCGATLFGHPLRQ